MIAIGQAARPFRSQPLSCSHIGGPGELVGSCDHPSDCALAI